MSQENRDVKGIKTYALVMVFSYSLEFKLINTPNSLLAILLPVNPAPAAGRSRTKRYTKNFII